MTGGADTGVSLRQVSPDLLLIEVAGRRVLTQAECPHRRGRLRYGYLNGRTLRITCPLHHSTFDLLTGRQVAGPPCGPLRVTLLPEDAAPPRVAADAGTDAGTDASTDAGTNADTHADAGAEAGAGAS